MAFTFTPATHMIARKAPTPCNHVCMNDMRYKQKFIGYEWAVIGMVGSLPMPKAKDRLAVYSSSTAASASII